MRITGLGSPNSLRRNGDAQRKTAAGATFAPNEAAASRNAAPTMAAAPLHSMDALLALQSVDDAMTGRRKAIARGTEVLDTLEDLKLDLLAGTIEPAKLQRLLTLIEDRPRTGEDGVDGVLDEIELRAKVELAKRQML